MKQKPDYFELSVKYLFLLFCAFLLVLAVAPISLYAALVAEDGPVETLTAIICFLGFYLSLKIFLLRNKLFSRSDFLLLLIGFLFLFVGGEEISWGQRILGLRPVFTGSEFNVQREFNIHNIGNLDFLIYFGGFLFIVVFTGILPLLSYFLEKVKKLYLKYGIPLMPPSICVGLWLGFIAFVLIPQIMYGRGRIFKVYYSGIYAIEELREFYFSLLLFSYMFVEYFSLLKNEEPYDPFPEKKRTSKKKGFFSSLRRDTLLVLKHNFGFIVLVIFLSFFLPSKIKLMRDYRLYLDKQTFHTDPEIVLIEGESVNASNAPYWFESKKELFGGRYIALYTQDIPKEGYIFFRYKFFIKDPGVYRIYLAGTPTGSRKETPFRHKHHSPYELFIDGVREKDMRLENTEEFLRQRGGYGFYLHYEYADNFYVTKLGEFYLAKGEHKIEFRINRKAVASNSYNFYADAIVVTPLAWRPRKKLHSLSEDIFSH